MTENAQAPRSNKFLIAYNDLNNSKKSKLQIDFNSEFGYTSIDTFYKKKNSDSPIYPNEKKWLAKYFNTTVEDLF